MKHFDSVYNAETYIRICANHIFPKLIEFSKGKNFNFKADGHLYKKDEDGLREAIGRFLEGADVDYSLNTFGGARLFKCLSFSISVSYTNKGDATYQHSSGYCEKYIYFWFNDAEVDFTPYAILDEQQLEYKKEKLLDTLSELRNRVVEFKKLAKTVEGYIPPKDLRLATLLNL